MRLKPREGAAASRAEDSFQYQKGAIKTVGRFAFNVDFFLFQYQKGAIKTLGVLYDGDHDMPDFNTKKVRLKLKG